MSSPLSCSFLSISSPSFFFLSSSFVWSSSYMGFSRRATKLSTRSGVSSTSGILFMGIVVWVQGQFLFWTTRGQGVLLECWVIYWTVRTIVIGHFFLFINLPLFSLFLLFAFLLSHSLPITIPVFITPV